MTKVLTVDDVEIEFEKQNSDHACKWCIYIRLRKSDKEQTTRKSDSVEITIAWMCVSMSDGVSNFHSLLFFVRV